MSGSDFEKWFEENGQGKENKYCNNIDYVFVTMKDGWVAIFEYNYIGGIDEYNPIIQAADLKHAEGYIFKRERLTVPSQRLC